VSLPNSRLIYNPNNYFCKFIEISNRSSALIIFPAGFAHQGALNKDSTVWLDGVRPPPNGLVNNFKLKMNLTFMSIKNCHQNWQVTVSMNEFAKFKTKSAFNELSSVEKNAFH